MLKIINEYRTVEMPGDFVVFLIGMRINKFWKPWKWMPIAAAMPRMLTQLAEAGVPTTVVDENPRAGGVVYRGTSRDGHDDESLGKLTAQKIAHYRELRERHRDKMTIRTGCLR